MLRVLLLVEGQTEKEFVDKVLKPYLLPNGICPKATIIKTRIRPVSSDDIGGVTSYTKFKRQLKILLLDSDAKAVSMMLDYYRLPSGFPGKDQALSDDCYGNVELFENKLSLDIDHPRFIPYFQLHEFEALLFSSIESIATHFDNEKKLLSELKEILDECNSPEEIDDHPESCPSKRLLKLCFPKYKKRTHGTRIAKKITIEKIRQQCPHFNDWIIKLENLAESQ